MHIASRRWGARTRPLVALVVLTSWFGTLLVATPFASPASAAPANPIAITGPAVSPDRDATPTWTFVLPADDPGTPVSVAPDPAVMTDPSDTATATIASTHRGKCFVGTAPPGSYADCVTPTGTPNEYSYTPSLTLDGDYRFYVHDVETETTTTTTYHQDGTTTVTGPTVTATTPGPDSVSSVYTYDGAGPALSFTSEPPPSGTSTTPSWTFSAANDAVSVTCSFTVGTTTTTPTCVTSYSPTLTANGTYTLTVTAKDLLNNATVISSSYTLTTASAPGVSVSPTLGQSITPTWTITAPTGTAPTSYSVVLTEPGASPSAPVSVPADPTTFGATYNPTLTPATNGVWTLDVTASVSGRPSAVGTASYRLDTAAPVVTITPASSAAPNASPTPNWTVSVADATATTVTCSVSPATPALESCAAAATWTASAEGTYVLTAMATDAAGNGGTGTSSYRYDVAPAAPSIVTPPTGNGSTVTWTVTTQSTDTLLCTVNGQGGFTATSGGATPDFSCPAGLSAAVTVPLPSGPGTDGNYFLTVTATDAGGTSSTTSTAYVLDRTAPATPTFGAGSSGSQNVAPVSWPFTAGGGVVTCRLIQAGPTGEVVGVAETSCSTPYARSLPSPGEFWVRVSVTDAARNTSSADSAHVIYDATNPDAPTVTRTSASPTSNAVTTWTLATTESSGFTFLCTWSGPAGYTTTEAACPASYSFTLPATNGLYTLTVVVRDAAGNRSFSTPGSVTFDDVAPVVTFINPPATPRKNPTVAWTTTVNETSVKTECQLIKRTNGPDLIVESWTTTLCGRTVTRTLVNDDGIYVLQVRDTDAAGNVNLAGTSSADVLLDTTAPGPPTVTGSSGFSQDPNASWTITPAAGQTDPSITYLCRLVKDNVTAGTTWVSCDTDPSTSEVVFTTTLPADGTYRLDVVATDPAGNLSAPVATGGPYTLDGVPPPPPTVTTTATVVNGVYVSSDPAPTWTLTGETDATGAPVGTFTCTWTTTISPVPNGMPANGTCATPYQKTLPADGLYTLSVTQTDRAGNTSTTATSKSFLLDRQAPNAPVVTGPVGPAKTTAVSYSFTAETGTTAECRLTYVTGLSVGSPAPIGTGAWVSCSSPWSVALAEGDGRYRAEVRVTDSAGNVSPAGLSGIYVLDTTGPLAPSFTAQPTGTKNVKAATWSWTGETPSTGTCTLSRTPPGATTASIVATAACSSGSYSTTLTYGDGFYQLAVQLTDPYNNAGAIALSTGYTLDATPPGAPAVVGPGGTSNDTTADYSITGPFEPGQTMECRLNVDTTLGTWGPCSLPQTFPLGADGSYVLEVRLTDQYGNLGPAGPSQAFLLDTKLPAAPVVTAPTSPSNKPAPTFTFTSDADATNVCSLARGAVVVATASCAGSFTAALTGLADGDYVLTVTAKDPAGNVSSGTSGAYTYDTTKPVPPSVTGPAGPSQNRNPAFSWSAELGAKPECSLQVDAAPSSAFVACSTPYAPTLSTDGTWVLTVRVTDAAGNVSDPGSSGGYLLDTTAPVAPTVIAPTSPGRDLAPSWSASTEAGSTTECRFSGPGVITAGFAACTLPVVTAVNGDGVYTFEVRATDAAGNLSAVGVGSYQLDTTAPVAPIVVQPTGPGRNRTPTIAFTTETGTTGTCRLTRGATVLSESAACTSPAQLDLTGLPDGAYTLSVRAIDAAGNTGPAGTATYVLDTSAPAAPTYTLIPGSPSSDRAPVYAFTHETKATPVCRLTTPGGVVKDLVCTSPLTLDLSNSVEGTYQLAVTAKDAAGNVSAAAASTYVLDSKAPAAPRVVGPTTPGSTRTPTWKFTAAAPTECRLLRGTTTFKDWAPCSSTYTADLFGQPDAVYALEVRVIGTTAATYSRYRLDSTGPGAAVLTAPPSPSTSRKAVWSVASAEVGATAECRTLVFGGVLTDWAPCAVSAEGSLYALDLTGLGDGTYSLVVRLTDSAGNVGSEATSDYVLDTSAPAAVGVTAPPSPGNDTTPTWTINSTSGVVLECRITSGQTVIDDFAPCAGSYTADLAGLPDGTYTLTVHALSAAGTPGPETTSLYVLDTTAAGAPGTLTGPTGPSRERAPSWTFVLASGSTATCKVTSNGITFREGPCTSPFTMDLSNAPDGSYTLTVRAIDAAGNIGDPATAGYILRTVPAPAPEFSQQPGSPSSTTDPKWAFTTVRGVTAQCRLLYNGSAQEDWTTCTSPMTVLLTGKPDGRYTLQVRAVDVAGNTSSPISSDYVFDRTAAPLAVFLETPVTPDNDTTPTWVVSAPAAAVTTTAPALLRAAALVGTPSVECRLTTPRGVGAWAPCGGTYTATTTGDGLYLLEARAVDSAGATGPASSSAYRLDTVAPLAPTFTDQPPAVGNEAGFSWSWNDDPLLAVECRFTRPTGSASAFAPCDSPYIVTAGTRGEGTYVLEARAVDAAGNIGPVTTGAYRFDKTPPPAPVFETRPPARGTGTTPTWTFDVPADTTATCIAKRNGTVVAEGACNGSYALDLRGQQPADWTVSVRYVDTAGNVGPSALGRYTLATAALVRDRVDGPVGPGTSVGGPFSPRPPTQGLPTDGVGPVGSPGVAGPVVPSADPRLGVLGRGVAPIKRAVDKVVKSIPPLRVPGIPEGTGVPDAIKNVIGSTITKPQLPIALFFIVLLFLLVQNRIDRRDPKLAAAPLSAEPELLFGPRVVQVGGAS